MAARRLYSNPQSRNYCVTTLSVMSRPEVIVTLDSSLCSKILCTISARVIVRPEFGFPLSTNTNRYEADHIPFPIVSKGHAM